MEATLERIGDRRMVSIPDELFRDMRMADDEAVDISMERDRIVIRKKGVGRLKSIEERCRKFYGVGLEEFLENPEKYRIEPESEVGWGSPVGSEVW
jgi:antitoxin component of MazEF toxin-antitoxin module